MRRRLARAAIQAAAATVLAVLTCLGVAVLIAPPARASTYDVSICGTGSGAGTSDGLTVVDYGGSGYMNTVDSCTSGDPKIMHGAFVPPPYQTFNWSGADGTATITAPPGTTIESLRMRAAVSGFQGYLTWDLMADGRLLNKWAAYYLSPASFNGTLSYTTNSSRVTSRFYCVMSTCSGSGTTVLLSAITPRISDTSAPSLTGSPGGSLLAGGPLRGTKGVSFSATDFGGGIYQVGLRVDGRDQQLQVPDANGGRCAKPFTYMVPCKLSVSSSFSVDTTRIPDGDHEVQVIVADATEEGRAVSAPTTVTIHNAPTSTDRPQLTGTPRLGTALAASTGAWLGAPTGYSYQWLRCASTVTSPAQTDTCSPVPGATRSDYTPGIDDAYKRNAVRVTATNASGSGSTYSAPSDLVADAQGRTAPPEPPSDGSPRDVIVVPVVPSTPPSQNNTTIVNPQVRGSDYGIAGLVNPLGSLPGHVANGSNASESARVRVAFEIRPRGVRRQVMSVRGRRSQRWVVKGRLTDAQGRPIGGGQLVAAWKINDRWAAHTGVKTLANGRFSYVLPRGPSRQLKFVYFAFSDSTHPNSSNVLTEKVATPVTLSVNPRAASNGTSITFRGRIGTDFIPRRGVLVLIEASYPGSGWKPVTNAHAGRDGTFTATYRFRRTSLLTRYRFRARCSAQASYPFEGGSSRLSTVLVQP